MGKNRVAPERPTKKRDNFFVKSAASKRPFKAKNKVNAVKEAKPSREGGSNGFFVRPQISKKKKTAEKPEGGEKKPFDKKLWRLQKYSKKYKLQQWEDQRKKTVLREYYKEIKDDDDEPKLDVKKIYDEHQSDDDDEQANINEENENNLNQNVDEEASVEPPRTAKQKKNRAFKKAHTEFKRIKEEKAKKKDDIAKVKEEKEKAIEIYKKKKAEKFKKLSQKTKKGQPVMKGRIELLLEKIEQSVSKQ